MKTLVFHLQASSLLFLIALPSTALAQDCNEGCTPGYWKNHPERWDGAGGDDFTTTVQHQLSFNAVFGVTVAESKMADDVTLLEALSSSNITALSAANEGNIYALNRHSAAGLADADSAILYPFTTIQVIDLYRDAVGAVAGPASIRSAHLLLEAANELGCPLSNSWQPDGICTYCYADEGDCPCGVPYPNGGCTNSTGLGGVLTYSGTASMAADDLVLTASQLPANRPVIWIMAPAQNRTVIRDGLLCISPGHLKIYRFPATTSNSNGVSVFGPGIVQKSIDHPVESAEIFPGDTRNFQAYYRDVGSPCGNDANTTNAVRVDFY